jgi:hypothetical protein
VGGVGGLINGGAAEKIFLFTCKSVQTRAINGLGSVNCVKFTGGMDGAAPGRMVVFVSVCVFVFMALFLVWFFGLKWAGVHTLGADVVAGMNGNPFGGVDRVWAGSSRRGSIQPRAVLRAG